MKLAQPINEAYAATVIRIDNTFELEGLDNLVGINALGYSGLIPKDYTSGLYVMFNAETQLSEQYCSENNLFRKADLNKDHSKKGYMEANRRIRAIKFRGHTSNCMIMPLDSLAYTGANLAGLKEHDTFDHLNGIEVCKKYVVKTNEPKAMKTQAPKFSRVDKRLLPEHIKTLQYWRYQDDFNGKNVVVTQKLHGSSIRLSNIPVARSLNWKERFAKKFGINVSETEYDYVYGSRRVIKDVNAEQNHFYGEDLWTAAGNRYKDAIPKNFIIYGELIGWVDKNKPIQRGYTYNLAPGSNELYVYRVATVNPDGVVTDLPWEGVKEFCIERGLNYVPDLWTGQGRDMDVESFMNRQYFVDGFKQAVPLSDPKTKDEGIAIRAESQIPIIAKAKCSEFLEHETKVLDRGEVDIEQS